MDKFSYHSEQVHTVVKNGYSNTRHNIVNIKNGKGEKIILKKQNDKNLLNNNNNSFSFFFLAEMQN